MRRARGLLRALAPVVLAAALCPVGIAAAEAPTVTITSPLNGSMTKSQTPSFVGTTNDPFDEVSLSIYEGAAVAGSPIQTLSSFPLLETWSLGPSTTLPADTYTVQASQDNTLLEILNSEAVLETGTSLPVTFTVDTVAPDVSLAAVQSPTDDNTPSFNGEAGVALGDIESVKLNIYAGSSASGSPLRTVEATPSGSSWNIGPVSTLADGTYTVQAQQSDEAGNTGKSLAATFRVDTTPPAVTLAAVASPSSDDTPSFSGSAGTATGDMASVKVKVYAGASASGSPVRTLTAIPSGGSWSSSSVAVLQDGTYTAQAEQSDTAGNTGDSPPVTFTVDTTPPNITLSAPLSGSWTNGGSQLVEGLAGTAEGDSHSITIDLFAGSSIGQQAPQETIVVQESGGHWSAAFGVLSEGTYTVRAEQADGAGNIGQSESATFMVDRAPPIVSLSSVPTPSTDNTPSLSGKAGTAPGDATSVRLKIYAGGVVSGSPVQTIEMTPSAGSWSSGPVSALADGTYTAQAEQSDAAGNTGKSLSVSFKVDTTPPSITLSAPVNGSWTNAGSQSVEGLAGTAEGDSHSITIDLFAGPSIGQQAPLETIVVQASGGHWSTAFGGLSEGTYTARAEQADEVDNIGQSESATFTVDRLAPSVSLAPVPSPSTNPTPSFSGSAGVAAGDMAKVKVKVYAGSSVSGSPVQTPLEATPSAGSWSTGPMSTLTDGTYTAQAEQSDLAGNTGKSEPVTFMIRTNGPKVTLTPLPSLISTATPTFGGNAGVAAGDDSEVTLKIHAGESPSGGLVRTLKVTPTGSVWTTGPVAALADGTYTVQAEQSDDLPETVQTAFFTFTVDTTAPVVTLASLATPTSDSTPTFSGSAGIATGDLHTVTLKLYPGSVVAGGPLLDLSVPSNGGAWTASPVEALTDGTYTAQAEQSDGAGNTGKSAPVTFVVFTPVPVVEPEQPVVTPTPSPSPAHSPPVASFTWFPSIPNVGESVTLVSNSTDASSPIAELAWSVAGSGAFQTGSSELTTTFSTPGNHVVRLRVLGTDGLSSIATETIPVSSPQLVLMQPFPIVRIAGTDTTNGAKLRLLTVQAPAGARITVSCRGRGCPGKPQSRTAAASRTGVDVIEFKRFERAFRAGAVIEIRVSKSGQIGKYTRFQIRRGKLPQRLDTCLNPVGLKPMGCPS